MIIIATRKTHVQIVDIYAAFLQKLQNNCTIEDEFNKKRQLAIFGGCALSNKIAEEKTTTIALAHHVFFFLCQYLLNYPTDSDELCGKVNATTGSTI